MLLIVVLLMLLADRANAQTIFLTYRGLFNTGQTFRDVNGGTTSVSGLSGITFLHDDQFLAVMDNSRTVVRMSISFAGDGSVKSARYSGITQVAQTHDFEGIAVEAPSAETVYLSEEDTPAIREFKLSDGAFLGQVQLPAVFLNGNTRGNFGLESLTIRNDEMWTANEEALKSDGDRSTSRSGCTVRLTRFKRKDGKWSADAQFLYDTDPIPGIPNNADGGKSRSGVSDLMLLPDGQVLVLERGFVLAGPANLLSKFRNQIYSVDISTAMNVLRMDHPRSNVVPARKHLLWSHEGNDIGNLEGLALGPRLGDDRWAVVGVVDNNANALMPNRIVAFELKLDPTPTTGSSR